MEEEIGP